MNKPEYWEDDEKWLEWNEHQKANPPKEEPLQGLRLAIAKARGDITCEQDMKDAVDFHNKLWEIYKKSLK